MINKKVKNAVKTTHDGVAFDSKIEKETYQLLKKANIPFKYNEVKFTLLEGFKLENIILYTRQTKGFILDNRKIRSMTYTPDFFIEEAGAVFIIETKGYYNDVYPYKKKLFLKYLEGLNIKVYFFEPRCIKEVKQVIGIINGEIRKITK